MAYSKQKERGDLFTLFFITIIGLVTHWVGSDYVTAILAMIGTLVANGLQPIFYPVVKKYEVDKDTFVIRKYGTGKHIFDFPRNVDPKNFNSLLYSRYTFEIQLPLVPLFKMVKIEFPENTGKDIYIDIDNLKFEYMAPGIDKPEIKGNALIIKVNLSAWSIVQIRYPVDVYQKLEDSLDTHISGIICPTFDGDKYQIGIDFVNSENISIKYIECSEEDLKIDDKDWEKIVEKIKGPDKEHIINRYGNRDEAGFYKGKPYIKANNVKPKEHRYYEIRSDQELSPMPSSYCET